MFDRRTKLVSALALAAVSLVWTCASAQGTNYDESRVPKFTLPDPLVASDGQPVGDAQAWFAKRRPKVLELFREHVYGRSPGRPCGMKFETLSVDGQALDGAAMRKEVRVLFNGSEGGPSMDILLYVPRNAKGPVPAFVGLNFAGNHSVDADPGIRLSTRWMRPDRANKKSVNHRAPETSRGLSASRWPIATIVARGYALATIYCGDIDPDFHDEFRNGVHVLDGGKPRRPDSWGTIAAWAWGLSRALDYFEVDEAVDHRRVAVLGHSRLGKTALWAGAQDERFALVISNNSGCGGAALSSRRFGETVGRINKSFPHWFCERFRDYNDNEDALPVDQHMLIALCAPRPVYVASAVKDRWADPRGEFLAAKHAEPVYRLLGTEGFGADSSATADLPAVDRPVMGRIGYHIRSGGHDVKLWDWERYLEFADKHLASTSR